MIFARLAEALPFGPEGSQALNGAKRARMTAKLLMLKNNVIMSNIMDEETEQKEEKQGSFIWETAKVVVLSLLIILPIRYFIMQPFFVRGESMIPSFDDKDYLIVDEISYRLGEPKRGEVIVFRFPQDPSQYYIKRIIGMPEETVEIANGIVTIFNRDNPAGFTLSEPYLTETTPGDVKIKLDEREYFVLGDNRDSSSDSRRWGPLYRHLIVGRAWIRVWPFNSAQAIASPVYLINNQGD